VPRRGVVGVRIYCEVRYIELEDIGDDGEEYTIDSVSACCGRCGHETESYGDGIASIKRCLVLLREECPNGENNFYVDEDE